MSLFTMTQTDGFKSLIYAVRFDVLAKLAGSLALVVAVLCIPSILVALWYAEYAYLVGFIAIILLLFCLYWLSRGMSEPQQLSRGEGFVITSATFVVIPLLLSVALSPCGLSLIDRLFETTSAVTTTGLSILPDIESTDKTLLFTRSWMQWYGGLGIVILSVIFLMSRSLATHQLLDMQAGHGIVSSTISYARNVLGVYLALTVFTVVICYFCFGDLFSGLLHGFSSISTGGFSSKNNSLEGLGWLAQFSVMFCGVIGAISLAIFLKLWRSGWRQVWEDQELRFFVAILLVTCTLLIVLAYVQSRDFETSLKTGVVMGMTALSTTGFANTDVHQLDSVFKLVLMIAMFIGGCLGSTAGGFKIFRLQLVFQLILVTLRRSTAAPHAVIEPRFQGEVITQEQIQVALLTGCLLVALCILSWLPFLYYGYEPLDALFEVVSAVGTVGLSSGVTSPQLPALLKLVLCVDMIAGRVEVIALICLFYPGLWVGIRNPGL